MKLGVLRGAAAGAAGTTALNAVTYLDMIMRARPSSDTPEQVVEKLADSAGVDIPGEGEERSNRLSALGPLFGLGVGVLVGAGAGIARQALHSRNSSIPAPVAVALIGAAAMLMSDVPLKLLGISDPAEWSATDWASDAIPHLAYGLVTYAALQTSADS